ncbi:MULTISPECIES: VWA domain-containing protein [unclassified Arthrobacter]|uniref:VWA domain-containing protein n=1 Tax=unclassified Arthrobacter TaxID=235627 RepID=UPI0028831ED8|nr:MULTISPECIES: VWA domain-containing protein [unclassified Arthrobacter]
MTFAPVIPWPLLILAVAAVLVFTVLALTRRRPWKPGQPGRSQPPRNAKPAALRSAAVVLLLLAMLRPGWPGGQATTATAEMDVFFVVDTSTSMAAEDYNGSNTRLAGVQRDVMAIAKELAGAKFSLITFDNKAAVRMPLTRDATALQTAMTTLQPQNARYAKGSSVTGAAQLLKDRLAAAKEQHPGRPALVFYAGDGENTSAEQPPALDAANVAGGAVLGYGTPQGGRMKETPDADAGYLTDRSSDTAQDAVSRIDEDQLRTIADQLRLPYAHRTGTEPPSDMLGKAQPGALTISDADTPGRIELYWLLALAAFLLVLHEPLRHLAALLNLRPAAAKERTP